MWTASNSVPHRTKTEPIEASNWVTPRVELVLGSTAGDETVHTGNGA